MKYENIVSGIFIDRPNRFIAHVEIEGKCEMCHVKNTGRCRELLVPGCTVFLQHFNSTIRKTAYDVIGVCKESNGKMINMDSQAPNKVVREWLESGGLIENITLLKPEKTYGDSRFDFYIEAAKRKIFIEVKGVTLEENGVARFPDAPTERGIKHMKELQKAKEQGYEAYIIFVIQMKGIRYFEPNDATHPAFGETLRQIVQTGVHVIAMDCVVDRDFLIVDKPVEIRL